MINKTEVEIQIVLDTENRLVVTSGEKIGAEAIKEYRIKTNKLLGI